MARITHLHLVDRVGQRHPRGGPAGGRVGLLPTSRITSLR